MTRLIEMSLVVFMTMACYSLYVCSFTFLREVDARRSKAGCEFRAWTEGERVECEIVSITRDVGSVCVEFLKVGDSRRYNQTVGDLFPGKGDTVACRLNWECGVVAPPAAFDPTTLHIRFAVVFFLGVMGTICLIATVGVFAAEWDRVDLCSRRHHPKEDKLE